MTSAPAIGFECRPSCWVVRALDGIGLLAIVAVMLGSWPVWLGVAAAVTVAGMVLAAQRRWKATPWTAAAWAATGEWRLSTPAHDEEPAQLTGFRVLGPCILLQFRRSGGEAALLLAPDNSDADVRRRLRMRLAATDLTAALPRI